MAKVAASGRQKIPGRPDQLLSWAKATTGGLFRQLLDEHDRLGPDHPSAGALTSAIFRAKKDLARQVKKGEISREQADELNKRYSLDFNNTLYYHRLWSGRASP